MRVVPWCVHRTWKGVVIIRTVSVLYSTLDAVYKLLVSENQYIKSNGEGEKVKLYERERARRKVREGFWHGW